MNIRLDGRSALICGGSKGIGAETAKLFAKLGAKVTLLARDQGALNATLKELSGEGHNAHSVDLSKIDRMSQVLDEILKTQNIDILICNSGGPKSGPILGASADEFLVAFQSHLIANHTLVQKFAPHMKKQRYGRIINIISTSVRIPLPNLGVSNTIRGAVASWAKTMANELGEHGITVNNVLPGFTKTDRLASLKNATATRVGKTEAEIENEWIQSVPMKRLGEPVEIANAIAFLASESASYINGINLPVDGGRLGTL